MTTRCALCGRAVLAGAFCSRCGAHLNPRRREGPRWLRARYFAAVPDHGILLPAVASTLFPRLTKQSRRVFHIAVAAMLVTLLALAALRITPAMIVVAALGIPLLFVLYLRDCRAFRDIPNHLPVLAATLGAGLGFTAMMLTGRWFAQTYDISWTAGMAWNKFLRHGLVIPLCAAMLKVVPVAVARVLSRPPRQALDGFAIGALGALAFSAAATLTRLAPQFALGWVAQRRSVPGLVIEAGISGVTVPLTAAAAGGTVGVALWFTAARDAAPGEVRRARAALAVLAAAVLLIYAGVVATDAADMGQVTVLLFHVALAVCAGLVLRLALQIALLHEAPGTFSGQPVGCGYCGEVVPEMPFCQACGVATAALPPAATPGTGVGRLLGTWTAAAAIGTVALIGVSALVTDRAKVYRCPPDCGHPPITVPVRDLPRYTAPGGEYTVNYPGLGTAYDVTTDDSGVTARLTAGDGGVLRLFALPADGRGPRDIAIGLLSTKFPDATIDYEIPNAMVGYQPGWGAAADRWPPGSTGRYVRQRILVVVAVKNDLALVAAGVGPFREFGPESGPGLPSGANVQIAEDMGKYVNSFRWRGDPEY